MAVSLFMQATLNRDARLNKEKLSFASETQLPIKASFAASL